MRSISFDGVEIARFNLAQLLTLNQRVSGSSPERPTNKINRFLSKTR
jgi:hypothetical protein